MTIAADDDPQVFVVDDDEGMRASLRLLFESVRYRVSCHGSAGDFLEQARADLSGCVVADMRMPEMNGLSMLRELAAAGVSLPVILVSGHADVTLAVAAMREGAYSFLTKPFREQEMLDTVAAALAQERSTRGAVQRERAMRAAFETLDPREREILTEVANGSRNKTIAAKLGLSEITIKVARARIMAKMGVDSAAGLARAAERLGIE